MSFLVALNLVAVYSSKMVYSRVLICF